MLEYRFSVFSSALITVPFAKIVTSAVWNETLGFFSIERWMSASLTISLKWCVAFSIFVSVYFFNAPVSSRFFDKALLKEGNETSLPEPSIKNKYFEMNPISSEEARKQLDLIDHDFYVFRNKKNNELQVIYKRNHGGYGLIQSK